VPWVLSGGTDGSLARRHCSDHAAVVFSATMDYRGIITIEPDKRGGKPCIRGTRMTVTDVLEYMAGGMTEAELLDEFPDLTHADILACLAFAADRERRLVTLPA
jgi:uncharacterized protein (DUF433 family)